MRHELNILIRETISPSEALFRHEAQGRDGNCSHWNSVTMGCASSNFICKTEDAKGYCSNGSL